MYRAVVARLSRRLAGPLGIVAIALLMPALAACQSTCAGDPRVDGLGCATIGLSSGAYARQTQSMQSQAENQLAASAAALRQANSAQGQASAAASQRQAMQQSVNAQAAEIARLRTQLDAASARLTQARNQPQPDVSEVARLEADVGALRRQIDALTAQ